MKVQLILGLLFTLALTACGGSDAGNEMPTVQLRPSIFDYHAKQGEINNIVIDGVAYELVPSNAQILDGYYIADDRVIGTRLDYGRFGYLNDRPFSWGIATATNDMPTFGKGRYFGHAVYADGDELKQGYSFFEVDFDKKRLKGGVSGSPIIHAGIVRDDGVYGAGTTLQAIISGNGFQGTYNGVATYGNFFGPKASELGGYYENDDGSISGAFGARQR